jgi:hypothetical protein
MNIDYNSESGDFSCEFCGRPLGEERLDCPERPRGFCPFEKESLSSGPAPNLALILIGIVTLLVVIWRLGSGFGPGVLLGALVGLAFIGIGLYVRIPGEMQLYNPESGLKWNRRSILGIPLNPTILMGGRMLPMDLQPLRPLHFPASVIKLPETGGKLGTPEIEPAVAVFRAAVVGLLTQGLVDIYRPEAFSLRQHEWLRLEQHIYVARIADGVEPTVAHGALEQAILKVLSAWSEQKESRKWPQGVRIYQLAMAVFLRNYSHSEKRLISLVLDDSLELLFGQHAELPVGQPTERTESRTATLAAIRSEREVVDDLLDQLKQRHSEFYETLGREARRGIRSRAKQDRLDGSRIGATWAEMP